MSQWTLETAPKHAPTATATTRGWENASGEVLVAIGNLLAKQTDSAAVPTFGTAAFSAAATYSLATFDVITITLTANEPVIVTGSPTIALTLFGGAVRAATYNSATSTDTSLKFDYTLTALDPTGAVVSTGTATASGSIYDKLPGGGRKLIPQGSRTFIAANVAGKSVVA